MVSALDVPADELIAKLSEKLKKETTIKPPEWAVFVKTGAYAERRPHNPDWWYVRCASILRKLYIKENIGVGELRNWYGGRHGPGTRPEHHVKAGGNIIRKALQQLESVGYVKKEKIGRSLSPLGRSFLEKTTLEILKTKPKKPKKLKFKKGEKIERARPKARAPREIKKTRGRKKKRITKKSSSKKSS